MNIWFLAKSPPKFYVARLVMRPVLPFIRVVLAVLVAGLAASLAARAGIAPYSDPGKIDFDQAMALLNPYGSWKQTAGKWSWTPLDHTAPYSSGRWLYSEDGWLWQGTGPTSWLTEHYGYWKRGGDKVWVWYPGPTWLPQTVEIRSSVDGIGWRSGEVDRDGNFVEPPSDRFTKVDEWFFVTPAQFAGPITPAVAAQGATAERLLEESGDSMHSYLTYRQIDRPGPHPADFVNLGDGRMFAPMTDQDRQAALKPKSSTATAPGGDDPPDDPRQVKYWVTMDLPTRWTIAPAAAKVDEIYLYRPDFYQDDDGIPRRIAYWLNPNLRSPTVHLEDLLTHRPGPAATGAGGAPAPDAALSSPFEAKFHPGTSSKAAAPPSPLNQAGAPTNSPSSLGPAPAGRAQ